MAKLTTRKSTRLGKSAVAPPQNKQKRTQKGAVTTKSKNTSPPPPKLNKRQAKAQAKKSQPPPKKLKSSPPKKQAESEDEEEEKMVYGLKKGGAVVDHHVPNANQYKVVVEGGNIFNRHLMKSNVVRNNNKYYIGQLLQKDSSNPGDDSLFFTRWGRVGQVNGTQIKKYPLNVGKNEFHKKINAKIAGGYREIQITYDSDQKEEKKTQKKGKPSQSKLHKKIKELMELIFDDKLLDDTLKQIGYDAKKMPLGKLSEEIINEGYDILNKISNVISKKAKGDLKVLSSAFYSCIPHDFGRKHMSNFIIKTQKDVKQKVEVLDTLKNMSIASKIMQKGKKAQENPLDANYKELETDINYLDPSSARFKLLKEYFQNTSKGQWTNYNLKEIFEINRKGEEQRFKRGKGKLKNHMLLWHGSRVSNFGGILRQGLRIAPPEAPASGYNFGKGLYFADMAAKSLGYSYSDKGGTDLLIMLVEVALGEPNLKMNFDFNAAKLPKGKDSTYGVGTTAPPDTSIKVIDNGVKVPVGEGKNNPKGKYLSYSEFIVYDITQVRLRYLLRYKEK